MVPSLRPQPPRAMGDTHCYLPYPPQEGPPQTNVFDAPISALTFCFLSCDMIALLLLFLYTLLNRRWHGGDGPELRERVSAHEAVSFGCRSTVLCQYEGSPMQGQSTPSLFDLRGFHSRGCSRWTRNEEALKRDAGLGPS